MNRRIEFTIERVSNEQGRAFVDGRVCESSIKVGDVFTKIVDQKQRWNGESWVEVDSRPTEKVRLVIQSIESYRQPWEELSSGMTARLSLTGDGLDRITAGRILSDDNSAQPG